MVCTSLLFTVDIVDSGVNVFSSGCQSRDQVASEELACVTESHVVSSDVVQSPEQMMSSLSLICDVNNDTNSLSSLNTSTTCTASSEATHLSSEATHLSSQPTHLPSEATHLSTEPSQQLVSSVQETSLYNVSQQLAQNTSSCFSNFPSSTLAPSSSLTSSHQLDFTSIHIRRQEYPPALRERQYDAVVISAQDDVDIAVAETFKHILMEFITLEVCLGSVKCNEQRASALSILCVYHWINVCHIRALGLYCILMHLLIPTLYKSFACLFNYFTYLIFPRLFTFLLFYLFTLRIGRPISEQEVIRGN